MFGNQCFDLDSYVIRKVLASPPGFHLAQLPWYYLAKLLEHCHQIFRFLVLKIFS